ncbi:MAG: hypothetical protein ACI4J6_04160 [Oscillospiraceae bacterium]
MKIKKRQNGFYSFFNGKNKIRTIFFIVWDIYFLTFLISYKHFFPWKFAASFECNFFIALLSVLLMGSIIMYNLSPKFYHPRFNPSTFYKYKSQKVSESKAIIATKKYIDLHYLNTYDADTLLSRLKKLKSDNDIFSQLPSNMIIGLVTGVISGMMINALSFNQDDNIEFYIFKSFLFIGFFCIITLIFVIFTYFTIKSFYYDYNYNATIVPYEISKIKHQLIEFDDIHSYIQL